MDADVNGDDGDASREALRAILRDEHDATIEKYGALKEQLRTRTLEALQRGGKYEGADDDHRELVRLKRQEQRLRGRLKRFDRGGEKTTTHQRQHRREELFIDVTRRRVGDDAYREIWAEVDRLERDQWRAVWNGDKP